jgi:hypothetical protein
MNQSFSHNLSFNENESQNFISTSQHKKLKEISPFEK